MEDIRINLPDDVRRIIKTIEDNGYEAYAVGGCVRDSILGRNPDDWDITTSARPEQIKSFFKKTIDTGIKHGTVTVMMNHTGYEVTTYRIDGEYKDGRHPESVEFSAKLVDDLKRRDFTINAMAYNESNGFVDEFNGIEDLNNHVIRCVGNPIERFSEDALRMMRAIRFSAQLGFDIDSKTYAAIVELAPAIRQVSMERVQVELAKTIMSDNPFYVKQYEQTGLLRENLSYMDEILSGKLVKNAMAMLKYAPKSTVLRYAAIFNMGEPDRVKAELKALKLDNYTVDTVTKLVAYSKDTIEENEPAVREAVHKYGKELLALMFENEEARINTKEEIVGISLNSQRLHLNRIKKMYEDIISRGDCISVKDLDITGNDLMEYGLSGVQIGKTLNELLHIVIENPKLNEKSTLLAMIEHID
jgi:tRNA nucleotidyltransferase (CCA-adding enzyme)